MGKSQFFSAFNQYLFAKLNLIDRNTGEKVLYNTIEDMAAVLNVKSSVLRNVVNGGLSKLHKLYIFKKELNDEN